MPRRKLLLVGTDEYAPRDLSAVLDNDSDHGLATEVVTLIREALERISAKGFDAVVCWAEREDELAGIIRLRKSGPEVPIVVLTSQNDPEFEALARQMGATRVIGKGEGLSSVSQLLRLALSTGELAREVRARAAEVQAQAGAIRELAGVTRKLSEEALARVGKRPRPSLLPLLVEDEPDQALLMVRAFHKADVFAPLPLMKSGEEAVRYLSGAVPFQNRARFPLPTLVLLDVNLPGMSGLEVLEWIKLQPSLRGLRVVMLSSSSDPANVNRAYAAGADAFLTKPASFGALVALVEGLQEHWGSA
jgi:CheY-like chemotaxis protein